VDEGLLKKLYELTEENNKMLRHLVENGITITIPDELTAPDDSVAPLTKDMKPHIIIDHDRIIEKRELATAWTDSETGLTWEVKSEETRNTILSYKETTEYIDSLNVMEYSGFHDWRLPTLKELKTLITKEKNLFSYIKKPLAKNTNYGYWTSTKYDENFYMIVNFRAGKESKSEKNNLDYIRCVRGEMK
jgi:hypothetical protein